MDLAAYAQASSPKWFITLLGAEHRLALTDEPSPYDELVTTTLLDFWHGTLDGDDEALERVTADATDPELSRVLHEQVRRDSGRSRRQPGQCWPTTASKGTWTIARWWSQPDPPPALDRRPCSCIGSVPT